MGPPLGPFNFGGIMDKLSQKVDLVKEGEPEQKHLESIEIHPGLTQEQADTHAVLGLAFMLNQLMRSYREQGDTFSNWYDPDNCSFNNNELNDILTKANVNQDYLQVAAVAMLLYFRTLEKCK